MDEQENWDLANTIYTIIEHRDETDSWRTSVMDILESVHTFGYWEGRA